MEIKMDAAIKLKKSHIRLMKHPETMLYTGVLLMGESVVTDDPNMPTACTDGLNSYYNRDYLNTLSVKQVTGLALHETLHKALKHIMRHQDLFKNDPQTIGSAVDYVVNDIIVNLKDTDLAELPPGGLYDPMFHNWSVRAVYDYLKQEQQGKSPQPPPGNSPGKPSPQGSSRRGEPLDKHDADSQFGEELTEEQIQQMNKKIDEALHQGGLLAGRMGSTVPRAIQKELEPEIRWEDVLDDWWSSNARGAEEYTYARYNRRRLADDLYLPSMYSETFGELVVAVDVSGSIDDVQLALVASRIQSLCELYPPELVRVLFWDTRVRQEQVFDSAHYGNLSKLLKPVGGGGTHLSCVSEFIRDKGYDNVEAIIVFTDGFVEDSIDWEGMTERTLWLVTHNERMKPPVGRMVMVKP